MKYMQDRDITAKHQLLEIAQALLLEKYQAGQMVFDHSQIGDRFYFVLSGSVTVEKPEIIQLSEDERKKRRELFDHKEETIFWAQMSIKKLQERNAKIIQMIAHYQEAIKKGLMDRSRNILNIQPSTTQNNVPESEQSKELHEVERDPAVARLSSVFHLQDKMQGKQFNIVQYMKTKNKSSINWKVPETQTDNQGVPTILAD